MQKITASGISTPIVFDSSFSRRRRGRREICLSPSVPPTATALSPASQPQVAR